MEYEVRCHISERLLLGYVKTWRFDYVHVDEVDTKFRELRSEMSSKKTAATSDNDSFPSEAAHLVIPTYSQQEPRIYLAGFVCSYTEPQRNQSGKLLGAGQNPVS